LYKSLNGNSVYTEIYITTQVKLVHLFNSFQSKGAMFFQDSPTEFFSKRLN